MTGSPADNRVAGDDTPARSYVVGLLGRGLAGSLAAALQEGEARAQGIPLAYRLLDADRVSLGLADTGDVLRWAATLGFDGLNVTHPFKRAALTAVDEATTEARLLGAVNTLTLTDGRSRGHNTDWLGFRDALRAEIPAAVGADVVVLGAGGAGVAVAYGALRAGVARVTLIDSEPGRAEAAAGALAEAVGPDRVDMAGSSPSDVAAALRGADGVVQATPVGMAGHPGMPFEPGLLDPAQWLAEIIYFPLETALARAVRKRGSAVMTGGAMVVHQHAAAFEVFTGRAADLARMSAHFATLTGER